MNRKQKTELRQARRDRNRRIEKEIEEAREPMEPEEIPLPEPEAAKGPEVEVVEKEYDDPMMSMGATSWDELDAQKMAQEQAQHVRHATWDTQDLVYNILGHPLMNPKDKAEAMKKVADGFGERVSEMMAEHDKMMKKDMDLLMAEALLAHDKRNSNLLDVMGDILSKAKLTASAEEKLSDEQFALVVEREGKKVRKYPIHDKAHVRNALARAAQMMKDGGEASMDAKAAMPKIRAAAKKMGIEMSMEKDHNAVLVEKDANDQWRAVWWVSNNRLDRQGDILSEAAHVEYLDWLEKNQDVAPVSLTWHTPGTARTHPMDFWMYQDGFLIMSNPLEEYEAEALLKAKAETDIGVSLGAFALARDPNDPRVVTKYRMFEVSDLPLENAANPFTDFEPICKEVEMDKQLYLATLVGKEKAEAFLKKAELKNQALDAAGIEKKEVAEEKPAEQVQEEVLKETETKAPAPAEMSALMEAVKKELGVEELSETMAKVLKAVEKVPVLEELVKSLSASKEEQLAEMLTPPASRYSWMQKARASQAEDTKVEGEEEEKLKKSAPGVPEGYWLSEVTGTAPVQVQ